MELSLQKFAKFSASKMGILTTDIWTTPQSDLG
jgi:hypothetical protein